MSLEQAPASFISVCIPGCRWENPVRFVYGLNNTSRPTPSKTNRHRHSYNEALVRKGSVQRSDGSYARKLTVIE
jgi:hypothetical protein